MTMTIPGIGTVPINQTEYTSGTVAQAYTAYMLIIQKILDKRADNPGANGQVATAQDYNDLVNALENLSNLAHNGAVDGTPPNTYKSYLTLDLGGKLNLVVQSLKAAGITFPPDPNVQTDAQKLTLVQNWQSLAGFGVESIVSSALQTNAPTRTLQSMIELEYVKEGNDIIFGQLNNLEQALQTTQNILNTLQVLENISNEVGPKNPLPYIQPSGDSNSFPGNYKTYASAHFAQISAIANPTSTAGIQLLQAKSSLMSQLALLQKQSGQTASAVNSLPFFIKQVINDISAAFKNANLNDPKSVLSAASAWIVDGENQKLGTPGATTAGNIQNTLQQAITASQSLNDTQKENVRKYLFIFEEFYKSATTLLQAITQIVTKMADNINH